MTDLMESLESQHRASHTFHRSLGISPKTRDSHIPTAPATDCFYWNETGLKKKKNEGRLHRNLDTAHERCELPLLGGHAHAHFRTSEGVTALGSFFSPARRVNDWE